jgi:hypothetical protein
MKCLICNADAKILHALGDWSEVWCPTECGHFRVSGNLVADLTAKKEFFDIERTRLWLEINRKTEPAPLISTYDCSVSLLRRGT